MGAAAGQGVRASFDGDGSLRSRPMGRILDPLAQMCAKVESVEGKLPASVDAVGLQGICYELPVASAQIKSAVLLAGIGAAGETTIIEPELCRDHTERMLTAFGAHIDQGETPQGARKTTLKGGQKLTATHVDVPGDPSSAAFLTAAALIVEGSDVTIENVLLNPLRAGFYATVREMGADITIFNNRTSGGEPIADLRVKASRLRGCIPPASRAASMIDEYPILAALAAFAEGESRFEGIGELRVKECDRIAAMEAGLRACGVAVESGPDWLSVNGSVSVGGGDAVRGGAKILTHHDHRIAMSFLIVGLASSLPVEIDDGSMIATSFPDFTALMTSLGAIID